MLKIELNPRKLIFGQGQRKNNEDYYYPGEEAPTERTPFFLVCDGMGGAQKGEVASRMAAEGFAQFFEENPIDVPTPEYLSRALAVVEQKFDQYLEEHQTAKGMGTTLTLLWFHQEGITIGHIGDSRVYRFRGGEAKPLTEDHSFVGELLAEGLITEEEAERHPKKNVITRAIQGAYTGGTKMTVQQLKKVEPDDIYMLCSDGITEACPTPILQDIYTANPKLEDLHQAIERQCKERSQDNFTALLIQVAAVETVSPVPEAEDVTMAVQPVAVAQPSVSDPVAAAKRSGQWRALIVVLLVAGAAIWAINQIPDGEKKPTAQIQENLEEDTLPPEPAQPSKPQRNPDNTPTTDDKKDTVPISDTSASNDSAPVDTNTAVISPLPELMPYQDEQSSLYGYKSDTVIKIKARFSEASPFSEGLAKVKDADKGLYGFIDRSGAYVFGPEFEQATDFKNGIATVQEPGSQNAYQIDTEGSKLAEEPKNQ
ncbi:MAG: protein phosphatase 2C domain-containing protein [bacterium]|nr:protein phosphatase 2C domain-containing protein [bacterium]